MAALRLIPPPLIFLLLLCTYSAAAAAAQLEKQTYIVHMDISAMPAIFSGHHEWYQSILSSKPQPDPTAAATAELREAASRLVYAYDNVLTGFSASLTMQELQELKNHPAFVSAYPDSGGVTIDTTHTFQLLDLNPVSGLWPASYYGEGVIVGVVDTGVWPESRSYDDTGMSPVPSKWKGGCESGYMFDNSTACNRKLIGARSFHKGIISQNPNFTLGMNSTRDVEGHGTHTSSTVAGNYVTGASYFGYASGTSRGLAPRAHLAMYKTFWEEGSYSSDVLAGIDRAIADGVDVISLSMGYDSTPFYEDPVAIASFAAMEQGIFVSTSAGNRGPFSGTLHNGTPWVLTVGASTVDREFGAAITLGNGVTVFGASMYLLKSLHNVPLFYSEATKACNSGNVLNRVVGRGKVVLCGFAENIAGQIEAVESSRVAGAIFITNVTYLAIDPPQFQFPGAALSPRDLHAVLKYAKMAKNPKVTMVFGKTVFGVKPAPQIAMYSSRGPSPTTPMVLKPDLVAPGSLILASWTRNASVASVGKKQLYNNFNLVSGTSMACPHASGVAALIKSIHPDWTPAMIRSAMITTTTHLDNTGQPIKDISQSQNQSQNHATPLAMGAGQIDPNKAMDPGLVYDLTRSDYIKFLCGLNYTEKQFKTITRSSYNECANTIPNLDLNYPSFIAFYDDPYGNSSSSSTGKKFYRTITSVSDGPMTYLAKLNFMEGLELSVEPSRLEFHGKGSKASFNLTIETKKSNNKKVVFGSLSWVEVKGRYVVRSPIVVAKLKETTK